MYSFNFSFKNVVENMGDSLIVLYLGWLFLSNKGDICKICKKDGWLFANHSFTISTLAAFAATIAVAVVGDLRGHGHGRGGLHYRLRRHW